MSKGLHSLAILGSLILVSIVLNSCHVGRYFYRNTAGVNDYRFFPSDSIKGNASTLMFPEKTERTTLSDNQLPAGHSSAEGFLRDTRTTSFLILVNDSLAMEWYGRDFDRESITPSFSVAKAVVSTLVGMAVESGDIPGLDTPVSTYLGDRIHLSLKDLSFRNLLDMRAGLNFRERYLLPFSPMAKYYYGRHLDRYVRQLRAEKTAGQEYEYQSAATQLAGMALERATGKDLVDYLGEKIWIPAGMGDGSSWSTDRPGGDPKFFCCLNTYPMDLLRFGALFVDGKNTSGRQIIPEGWTESIINSVTSSRDSQGYPYALGWRITPRGGIFAKGVMGQYIYVNPTRNVVIVRTGKKAGGFDWGQWFDEIANQF